MLLNCGAPSMKSVFTVLYVPSMSSLTDKCSLTILIAPSLVHDLFVTIADWLLIRRRLTVADDN